jgi:hypothetical protein
MNVRHFLLITVLIALSLAFYSISKKIKSTTEISRSLARSLSCKHSKKNEAILKLEIMNVATKSNSALEINYRIIVKDERN